MAIALIGRPNVGKSSLFNRFLGRREALVWNEEGVTRDRLVGQWFTHDDKSYVEIWDLAGWGQDRDFEALSESQKSKIHTYLFIVDGSQPLTTRDLDIIQKVRRLRKPLYVVVNKSDHKTFLNYQYEVQEYLPCDPYFISAETGEGIETLRADLLKKLPKEAWKKIKTSDSAKKVLLLGRPNVGKSSLLNRLGGTDMALVSEKAGTTRDLSEWYIEKKGQAYRFIDSAGVRKKGKIFSKRDLVEVFSVEKALSALKKSDFCVFLCEGHPRGLLHTQDKKLLRLIREAKKPTLVVINKWDRYRELWKRKTYKNSIRHELGEYSHLPILLISAKTGFQVSRIIEELGKLEKKTRQIPTSQLNRWLHETYQIRQPRIIRKGSSEKGHKKTQNKYLRFHYMNQLSVSPMRFQIFSNAPAQVPKDEKRYLENSLREAFGLEGLPIDVFFRQKAKVKSKSKPLAQGERA